MVKLTYCPICNKITYHDRDKIYHCPICNHHLNTTDLKGDDIMSNEYREWEKDRKTEAWDDICKIADLIEDWRNKGSGSSDIIYAFLDIVKVIEEGGWL